MVATSFSGAALGSGYLETQRVNLAGLPVSGALTEDRQNIIAARRDTRLSNTPPWSTNKGKTVFNYAHSQLSKFSVWIR